MPKYKFIDDLFTNNNIDGLKDEKDNIEKIITEYKEELYENFNSKTESRIKEEEKRLEYIKEKIKLLRKNN